jgi:hypothetical protein
MPRLRDSGEKMMRFDVIRKSAALALGSGLLAGFLLAPGCSDRPASGNKLDDPELKAYMKKTTDAFKTKMEEMKTAKPKTESSKGFRHP